MDLFAGAGWREINPDLVGAGRGRSGPVGDVNVLESVSRGSAGKSGVPIIWNLIMEIRVVLWISDDTENKSTTWINLAVLWTINALNGK